ncbi:MAG: class B sortase [Oscillospiraceae bacterium]|nr:class B sortase [Oscillospiraceae bacterium]
MTSKQKLYILLGVLCLILCSVFILLALPRRNDLEIPGGPSEGNGNSPSSESSQTVSHVDPSSSEGSEAPGETSGEPPVEAYDSPVDFETLQNRCGDIYAWLDIPDAGISYPVVQSQTDDSFYLDHSIDGKKDENGTLFTEHAYNGLTFSDPVTIIYGHNMRSGAMFGLLQEQFSQKDWFDAHEKIIVYQPERELHYQVFAAVPYGTKHILYQYRCFRDPSALTEFLDVVYNIRKFGKNYREGCTVTQDDRVLILSTCLPRSADGRYLVLAKLEKVVGKPLETIEK